MLTKYYNVFNEPFDPTDLRRCLSNIPNYLSGEELHFSSNFRLRCQSHSSHFSLVCLQSSVHGPTSDSKTRLSATRSACFSAPLRNNSAWIRGAPQVGFSRHIRRMRSRTSRSTGASTSLLWCINNSSSGSLPQRNRDASPSWEDHIVARTQSVDR